MGFDWQLYGKKPNGVFAYIGWLYYTYCIITGLYMLDSWERTIFNATLIVLISMSFYTAYLFLPQHVFAMLAHFGVVEAAAS